MHFRLLCSTDERVLTNVNNAPTAEIGEILPDDTYVIQFITDLEAPDDWQCAGTDSDTNAYLTVNGGQLTFILDSCPDNPDPSRFGYSTYIT